MTGQRVDRAGLPDRMVARLRGTGPDLAVVAHHHQTGLGGADLGAEALPDIGDRRRPVAQRAGLAAAQGSSTGAGSSMVFSGISPREPSASRSRIPDWSEPSGFPPVASRL